MCLYNSLVSNTPRKRPFSDEEKTALLEGVKLYGRQWIKIKIRFRHLFEDRTGNTLHYFYKVLVGNSSNTEKNVDDGPLHCASKNIKEASLNNYEMNNNNNMKIVQERLEENVSSSKITQYCSNDSLSSKIVDKYDGSSDNNSYSKIVFETKQKKNDIGNWTVEEHATFVKAFNIYGNDWKKVAAEVKTRTERQTRYHAETYYSPTIKLKNSKCETDKSWKSGTVVVDSR